MLHIRQVEQDTGALLRGTLDVSTRAGCYFCEGAFVAQIPTTWNRLAVLLAPGPDESSNQF